MDPKEQLESLRRTLAEEEGNLLLIEEQKARYVLETEIPPTLIKEERRKRDRIAALIQRIQALEGSQGQPVGDLPAETIDPAQPLHGPQPLTAPGQPTLPVSAA